MIRRSMLLLALLVAGTASYNALGQAWPARPLRAIVPYGPGTGPDIVGRLVAAELQTRLGQPVIVENRLGAGGKIAVEAAAKAKGDPYTLFVGTVDTQCMLPHLYPGWEVNPATDLIAVAPFTLVPLVIAANPALPVADIQELIAYAKANPGIPYGSPGVGTILHLTAERFNDRFGTRLTHVPFRNFADAFPATQRGDLKLVIAGILPLQGFLKDGRLKPLVVTGKVRSPTLPNVPSFTESGIAGMEESSWFGLFTPAGVSADIVNRLNQEVAAVTATPAFNARMEAMAAFPMRATPSEFAASIAAESAKWGEVIRKAGIRME
jgi:tripartite-type tricarboxylate transporter receptor subunit TctC